MDKRKTSVEEDYYFEGYYENLIQKFTRELLELFERTQDLLSNIQAENPERTKISVAAHNLEFAIKDFGLTLLLVMKTQHKLFLFYFKKKNKAEYNQFIQKLMSPNQKTIQNLNPILEDLLEQFPDYEEITFNFKRPLETFRDNLDSLLKEFLSIKKEESNAS